MELEEEKNEELIKRLDKTVRKVIDMQMRGNEPPETREAFDRLLSLGFTESECYEMIGRVVVDEFKNIFNKEQGFDIQRYAEKLERLPQPYAIKS